MNKKNIIYTLTTSLALSLGSCASEDFWDTFDRTVDGPIDFTVGVESTPAERFLTRADAPDYYAMQAETQIRLKVDGKWAGKTNEDISQTATCKANPSTSKINSLTYDEGQALYWDDYGAGDPDNSTNTANGLTILGVAIDGKNDAPVVGNDQWDNLPWTVVTDGEDVLKSDIIISNNLTTSPYSFANRNDDDAKKMIFTHPLSKITFNLKAGKGFDADTFNPIVKLSDKAGNSYALTDGYVKIQSGKAENNGTKAVVIAGTTSTPKSTDVTIIKEAIVYPGTLLGSSDKKMLDDNTIIAVLNANDNVYYVTAAEIRKAMQNKDASTDFTTKAGYNYIIKLTVNKTGIRTTATVTDWNSIESEEVSPVINVKSKVGGGTGTTTPDGFKTFSFWRRDNSETDFKDEASPTGTAGTGDWDFGEHVLYWTNHNQHFHFRGVFPEYNENALKGAKVEKDGAGNQVVKVANGVYNKDEFPCNFMIGMPEIGDSEDEYLCNGETHTPVDMRTNGICARSSAINLNFRYMMSQVEVKLISNEDKLADDYVDLTYAEVELVNVGTAGNILLSDRSAKVTTESDTYPLNCVGSSNIHYHDIIVPQTLVSNNSNKVKFKITVYTDNTKTAKDVYYADVAPIKVKKSGSTDEAAAVSAWESGVHYVYNLKITKTEIKATATLTDWTTVEASEDVWF
jgi:hypothetical protein